MRNLLPVLVALAVPLAPSARTGVPPDVPGTSGTITMIDSTAARTQESAAAAANAIETWLEGYDAAFTAKNLEKLASFYHPDVTVYEGGGVNNGWADYRDHHLGPELEELQELQFSHSNTTVNLLSGGQAAYVTSEYSLKAAIGERAIDARGLETLVVIKDADGGWRIRHSHTSSRPARQAPQ